MISTFELFSTIIKFLGCNIKELSLPVLIWTISIGLANSIFLGICTYAPSFEKDVFNKLNESLLLVSLLKYLPNNFEYLSLFRIADKIHISTPSCVVSDQKGSYIPSIKTIL